MENLNRIITKGGPRKRRPHRHFYGRLDPEREGENWNFPAEELSIRVNKKDTVPSKNYWGKGRKNKPDRRLAQRGGPEKKGRRASISPRYQLKGRPAEKTTHQKKKSSMKREYVVWGGKGAGDR